MPFAYMIPVLITSQNNMDLAGLCLVRQVQPISSILLVPVHFLLLSCCEACMALPVFGIAKSDPALGYRVQHPYFVAAPYLVLHP